MSEIVTEIEDTQDPIATTEFLGFTFEERKRALEKIESFRLMAQRALLDTVMLHTGEEVQMTFRPSFVSERKYPSTFSCYSVRDKDRTPLTREVTILGVDEDALTVNVATGELRDDRYDAVWEVRLNNILALKPIADA